MSRRVPAVAVAALRRHIERFFRAHGVIEGVQRGDVELDLVDLGSMLLAALRHVREAHPWIGRKGAVLDPPDDDPPELAFAVADALPAYDAPLTVDACIAALRRAAPFELDDAPCGRRPAAPRAYPYRSRGEHTVGVIAEDGWLDDAGRRDRVLQAAVRANDEPIAFIELDVERAQLLAGYLLAGRERRAAHRAHADRAAAFVRSFGPGTRCFASSPLDLDCEQDPFAHGSPWSRAGCWGRTLVLAVTDGLRVASLDALWDVTGE